MKMETDRLIIRDYNENDLTDMHSLWSDRETMYYIDDILCDTIEDTAKYLKKRIRKRRRTLFLHLR